MHYEILGSFPVGQQLNCLLSASAVCHYVQLSVKMKFLILQNVPSLATLYDRWFTGPMSLCVCVSVQLPVERKVYSMTITYTRS
jgi:hypothetical protein